MADKRFRIVYEDDWLVVVDKPSGLLVIPTPKKESNTLTGLLNADLDSRGIEANAYPCHRLDRETSGLIVYAKGKKAQAFVMDEFAARRVKKRYVAFVNGAIKKDRGVVTNKIFNKNKKRWNEAETRYRVLERRSAFTILEAEPVTGRTNQIRIHFKSIGHPILGDRVFAFGRDFEVRFPRVALHAASLRFTHPVTNEEIRFEAPLPSDMDKLMKGKAR